ncbi:MAG: hypothetical protein WCO13_06220 [Bacteroidota bacterium]
MSIEKSYVRNDEGKVTHVDFTNNGTGKTERWETYYPGDSTPKNLVGVQSHENGEFRETNGYDWLGPNYVD